MTKRISMTAMRALGPSALLVVAAACGSSGPTAQLVQARQTMQIAKASGTEQLAPNRMQEAQDALVQAERAHSDDPGSNQEANLAYVAKRKAQIAMASGKIVTSMKTEAALNEEYQSRLEQASQSQRQQLREQARENQETSQASRAEDALESLDEVATVKHEKNGTVITLEGAALFPTGGDTLSDEARQNLDKVAKALQLQEKDTKVTIEGHADSTGNVAKNEDLSKRRADAVRGYLTQRGVDGAMLESIGRGTADPVANNATGDGRAENRRADIEVKLPEAEPTKMNLKQRPSSPAAKSPGEEK
jgi:outer membrane protein OmpA-like peptidoglycan-associated protein